MVMGTGLSDPPPGGRGAQQGRPSRSLLPCCPAPRDTPLLQLFCFLLIRDLVLPCST